MTTSDNDLWYSKFHKVIKRADSLTILSCTEKGVSFGSDQKNGALVQGFPKSVNVFADLVTLCQPDADEKINFGSTEAETVTLCATRLVTRVGSSAVVSARGKSGKPNDAASENGRAETHGRPGHTLNVYVGQAPSGFLNVSFDAKGGRGATTEEIDQPAGNGGDGGKVTVYVTSTWSSIFLSLRQTARALDPQGLLEEGSDSEVSDDDDERRHEELDRTPLTASDFGRVAGIVRMTSRLCEDSDPLSQRVVTALQPLSIPTIAISRSKVVEVVKMLAENLTDALDSQSVHVRNSTSAPGGIGGDASARDGQHGPRGKDGNAGTSEWQLFRKAIAAGPVSFAPLHPLQCRMQLEKAAALFYFGDRDSLHAAQRVLCRLVARMGAVLDLDDDHSAAIKYLSTGARDTREKRLRALEEVYKAQRNILGIPSQMQNPVGELRRIGREAYAMLFRLTRTSVDYYGYQDNWAPRQSVHVFQSETKSSLDELEKSEQLFLTLSRRLENVETDEATRQATIDRAETGKKTIGEEQQKIVERLNNLRLRIFNATLMGELHRRSEVLLHALEELQRQTEGSFNFSWDRVLQSLGNIAKEVKVSDVIRPRKKEGRYEVLSARIPKSNHTGDKKEPNGPKGFALFAFAGFAEKLWGKAGGEITDMIYEGINTIPNIDGEHIDKRLIVRQIKSIVGDLKKLDESSMAKLVKGANGQIRIDEDQDNLLVTSQTQIDKFVEDFVGAASIGPQAEKAQKALQDYADMLAERNHDKLQYNLEIRALLKAIEMADGLEQRETELRNEGFRKDDADQLGQMAQMAEDIYSWDRARTMRLISIYRRAIHLATLTKPTGGGAGGHTSDAALILPAAKLRDMFKHLHDDLFKLQESAGSDASHYPPDFAKDHGKFVDLSPEELQMLLKYGQIRVTLPAPTREFTDDDLPGFRGSAEVRVYRVRFWLEGIRIKSDSARDQTEFPVKISLSHAGDSIYFDRRGQLHAFAHDPVYPAWSYVLLPTPNGRHRVRISESGDIVTDRGEVMAYAAPSPFASWTISLKYLDRKHLDLTAVTRGRFEFFGTTRDFDP